MPRSQHRVALWIVLLLAGCGCSRAQTAPSRQVEPVEASSLTRQTGSYYALVIGNQNYKYLGPKGSLTTPIRDATEVAKVLHDTYGFETQLLLDADRNQILTALVNYRRTLAENANLLIYYAGHGHHDRDADEAYWWPVDARLDNNANWISADDITRDIKAMPSRHVLVISDSCYSGALAADYRAVNARIEPEKREALLAKLLSSRSRMLMSSGRDEPVTDVGAPGHSYFAAALLESLRAIDENTFTGAELFYDYVQPSVGGGSEQVPQYDWILNSGHQYGDFVFRRRVSLPSVVKAPAAPVVAPALGRTESELGRITKVAAPPSPAVGWALTAAGTLLHTDDGVNWERRNRWKGSSWRNVLAFVDPQSGWIIENGTDLLHTDDGGRSWRVQVTRKKLESVAFITPQSGWVLAGDTLLHTEDGGHVWVEQLRGAASGLEWMAFASSRSAWLVGTGTILHTEDAGLHWARQSFSSNRIEAYAGATFVSPQEGWIVGAMGLILHTQDGGTSWVQQSSGTDSVLFSVSFANALSGWIVGSKGTILHTEDGGSHWVRQESGTANGLFSVKFINAQSGWAVGDGGVLYTEDAGATWTRPYRDDYETVWSLAIFKQP